MTARRDTSFYGCTLCLLFGHENDADNSLTRPGRKQATVTEDFDIHISYL
jgi:hypothetical protein